MQQAIDNIRKTVYAQQPLIHCITNPISINQCANAILAVGARPIMAEHPAEAAEITQTARSLMLNLGNITDARMESILISAGTAQAGRIPMILDAVGIVCSALRREYVRNFLKTIVPTVIKGNYSEIQALHRESYCSSGVDADPAPDGGSTAGRCDLSADPGEGQNHPGIPVPGPEGHALTQTFGAPLIIDDRLDIAMAIDAEGVHLGQSDMPIDLARKIFGQEKIIGATAKTVTQALEAWKQGADYLGVGAIYPTTTKVKTGHTSPDTLREICNAVPIPVNAIGGLNKDNLAVLSGIPIAGICVVSAIMKAEDPKQAAIELKARAKELQLV